MKTQISVYFVIWAIFVLIALFEISNYTRKQLEATYRIENRMIRAENERLDELRRIARIDSISTLTPK